MTDGEIAATVERLRRFADEHPPVENTIERDEVPELPAARAARLEAELAAFERDDSTLHYPAFRMLDPDDAEALHLRLRALVDRAPGWIYRPDILSSLARCAPSSLREARLRDVLDAYARDGLREENQGNLPFWDVAELLPPSLAKEALALAERAGSYAAMYGCAPLVERLLALGEPMATLILHARAIVIPAARLQAWGALVRAAALESRAALVAELIAWLAHELPPQPPGEEEGYSSGRIQGDSSTVLELIEVTPVPARAALLDGLEALVVARPFPLLADLEAAMPILARLDETARARRLLALVPDGEELAVEARLALGAALAGAQDALRAELVAEAEQRWVALPSRERGWALYSIWEHAAWIPRAWLARALAGWLDDAPRPSELPRWLALLGYLDRR